jgi:hypothetical protein
MGMVLIYEKSMWHKKIKSLVVGCMMAKVLTSVVTQIVHFSVVGPRCERAKYLEYGGRVHTGGGRRVCEEETLEGWATSSTPTPTALPPSLHITLYIARSCHCECFQAAKLLIACVPRFFCFCIAAERNCCTAAASHHGRQEVPHADGRPGHGHSPQCGRPRLPEGIRLLLFPCHSACQCGSLLHVLAQVPPTGNGLMQEIFVWEFLEHLFLR